MANSITWAIRRFLRLDGRNDREKRDRHRDIGGSPYAEPARPAMRARASPERSHLRPGQPVPGSCPASPSAAAGLAVPPAITLQSLRRRHRRQFCSPQPWQLRARASSIRRRRHLTPRAGQRHQPLTARPNLPFPTLASSASKSSRRTSLLQRMQRQHHVRGRADWRTCMPSHAPHSPPAWIDQLTAPPAPPPRVVS